MQNTSIDYRWKLPWLQQTYIEEYNYGIVHTFLGLAPGSINL